MRDIPDFYRPRFGSHVIEWEEVFVNRGVTETAYHLTPSARDGLTLWSGYRVPLISYWRAWWQ